MGGRVDGPLPLVRARPAAEPARPPRPAWLRAALAVPLHAKLLGANLLVAAAAAAALAAAPAGASVRDAAPVLGGALLVALALNTLLVRLALRPVRALEATAARVWRGDLDARVPASPVADVEVARLGRTLNLLLDGLADDRARLRAMAALTVRAQDDERARIARELHDSTAQTIAALGYQLAAAAREASDPALATAPDVAGRLAAHLAAARELAGQAVEEVRVLAHTIHPRVLDDLGLGPALAWLARRTREHSGLDVEVDAENDAPDAGAALADALPRETAATLYRVAQESLRNVERHAGATAARVRLAGDGDAVTLEVSDDGRGFDAAEAEARRPGMGLFAMRERVALVGGALEITTAPGRGTRVRARVPAPTPHSPPGHGG